MDTNTGKIFDKLPEDLKLRVMQLPEHVLRDFEEIRIRAGKESMLICGGREYRLGDNKNINTSILDETLNRLLDYSYYAYEDELSKGYITIEGGHRVGICGRVTLSNGNVHLIKDVSSLNIRRSKEIIGAAKPLLNSVRDESSGEIKNTLIISPPKCGKTTMLRDMARSMSLMGYKVSICDERSEIAGCYDGRPSYDLGTRTDILDGCPKAQGITMLIRSMSPDVIITDEIGKAEDVKAIEEALCSGVKIITSIHGRTYSDVRNSSVGDLIKDHVFETLIFLTSQPKTGTVSKIMKLSDMKKGA